MKKILQDKKMWFFFGITILFYGLFFKMNFAPDTYGVLSQGARNICTHFLQCGRVITAVAYAIVHILKFNDYTIYFLSFLLGIVALTLSQYKLYKMIKEDIKNEYINIILPILIVLNVFCVELMLYIEKGIMCLSVLLSIYAVDKIKKYFESKEKNNIIYAIIILFLATCCYQGTIAIFIIIAMIYILKNSKNIKQFICNNFIVAVTYAIPSILNFAMIKLIFGNSRVSGTINLLESIEKIIAGTRNMILTTYNLLPKGFLIFFVAIIITIIIYIAIKSKNVKHTTLKVLSILYVGLGIIFSTIFPQIMQDTNSIWFVARSTYGYASILGIFIWLLFLNENTDNINNLIKNIIIVLSTIYIVLQYIYCESLILNQYIVNYQDKKEVIKIGELIEQYEKETGNKISKISVYKDKEPKYTYDEILSTGDINIKALYPDWSTVAIINYYTKRNLKNIENDRGIKESFKNKNWNEFSVEQIQFNGDTIHICTY